MLLAQAIASVFIVAAAAHFESGEGAVSQQVPLSLRGGNPRSLNANEGSNAQGERKANGEGGPLTNAYESGWYFGVVTDAHTCETDDYGGINNPISMEGYALNVCIMEGGHHVRYQCDGESIIQERYSNANCTAYTAYYPVQTVGCNANVVYNCSSDNSTIPVPPGQKFVTQLYYEASHTTQPNCTGQVQYFVGQANEHCFQTPSGSQYNEYPTLQVYTSTNCHGDYTTNDDVKECTLDLAYSAGGQISYTHFNTTLIAGPPNHPPPPVPDSDGGDNDDFFDDETALIGVAVGGGVAVALAAGVGYYFMAKPSEALLTGAASSG